MYKALVCGVLLSFSFASLQKEGEVERRAEATLKSKRENSALLRALLAAFCSLSLSVFGFNGDRMEQSEFLLIIIHKSNLAPHPIICILASCYIY